MMPYATDAEADMHTVGIEMLREDLVAYVARARAGERIVITNRGEAVAELSPLSPEVRLIQRLVADGTARWSGRRPELRDTGVVNRGPSLSGTIVEDRDG
jgi:prevent-host-death family protein